jgi:hypothetical protein
MTAAQAGTGIVIENPLSGERITIPARPPGMIRVD